ncbi:unnamed protein product [Adineta steineri]|uniref:Uncharacterized protein n=1 Tax=Adineta steineri TaxID=433720 RepID=A0A818P502_9BILA|nr:unnamed protein product [Adineta steineri]
MKQKFRLNVPVILPNQTNLVEFINEISTKIGETIDINPNQIKATLTRPTVIMTELMKKGGHTGDKF